MILHVHVLRLTPIDHSRRSDEAFLFGSVYRGSLHTSLELYAGAARIVSARAWAPHALQIDAVAAALPADEVHTLARALGGGISSKAMAALNAAHAAAMANSCAI